VAEAAARRDPGRSFAMKLSVIIVNWNSSDHIRRCLASLAQHVRFPVHEVIVIDSGSHDDCGTMLAREFPAVRFLQSPENLGFGRANNEAVRHATGTHLLLLNPDTEFCDDALIKLVTAARDLEDAGAIGARLLQPDGTVQTSCVQALPTLWNQLLDAECLRQLTPRAAWWGTAALTGPTTESVEVEAVSGACILIDRQRFEEVGGFTDTFFMYGEDLDLCHKLRADGWRNYHVPTARIIHYGGGSSSRAPSGFSTVQMRVAVHHFFQLRHGRAAAMAYRATTALAACGRLAAIGPLLPLGRGIVRHGTESWTKWGAILAWSLGLRTGQTAAAERP
jgi:GT2 family glycosyltransferase